MNWLRPGPRRMVPTAPGFRALHADVKYSSAGHLFAHGTIALAVRHDPYIALSTSTPQLHDPINRRTAHHHHT